MLCVVSLVVWLFILLCCVVGVFSSYSLRIWLGWRFVVVVDCYDFGLCVIGLRLICWGDAVCWWFGWFDGCRCCCCGYAIVFGQLSCVWFGFLMVAGFGGWFEMCVW